jgi:hypothetical protein
MRRLDLLSFVLTALVTACGRVVVDGDVDRGGGGSAGSTSAGDFGSVCLQNCAVQNAACDPGVNDCVSLCDKVVAVAGESDTCATAASALVECLGNSRQECAAVCDDAAKPFSSCYAMWCAANPEPCGQ